jgi:hypothetical protein
MNGLFGLAEWVAVIGGAAGLLFVMLTCSPKQRWALAFGAFSTGGAASMFVLLAYAMAMDKELFERTVTSSMVPVFAAFLYSAAVSAKSLWEMRIDRRGRYS